MGPSSASNTTHSFIHSYKHTHKGSTYRASRCSGK